jgi:type IV pilus assembly protein PilN
VIRINLLDTDRSSGRRVVFVPVAHRVTVAASLILLAAVLTVGWWFWSLRQTSLRLDRELAQADSETQQLRAVLGQVQKFETRRAQLQQRVALIEQLRRGQTGPVHVLDEIARALPERLWLTELTQKGAELTLTGVTTSLSGVSDFVANLESSAWFRRPVDIIDSEMAADPRAGELVKFSVKALMHNPEAPAPLEKP